MSKISKSVGKGGKNEEADVKIVQELLNKFTKLGGYSKLDEDGKVGDKTLAAIAAFQQKVVKMAHPDKLVNPGGPTIKKLNESPSSVAKEAKKDEDGAGAGKGKVTGQKSGAAWYYANEKKYADNHSVGDLDSGFGKNVKDFIAALEAAGAKVVVGSTFRPAGRAYVMHWCYLIAKGSVKPSAVPKLAGVDIQWDHGDDAASKKAAQEMVERFHIVYEPALTSRHTEGKAIDMTITWSGELKIKNKKGEEVTIKSSPRNGQNTELHEVGKSYGVIKLVKDHPHWSSDGK